MFMFIHTVTEKTADGSHTSSHPHVTNAGVLLTSPHLKGAKRTMSVFVEQVMDTDFHGMDCAVDWSDDETRVDIVVDREENTIIHTISLHFFAVV